MKPESASARSKRVRQECRDRSASRGSHSGEYRAARCENPGHVWPNGLQLDHFFGRAKAEESQATTWLLCVDCHQMKTENKPSAAHWLKQFAQHCHNTLERTVWQRFPSPAMAKRELWIDDALVRAEYRQSIDRCRAKWLVLRAKGRA